VLGINLDAFALVRKLIDHGSPYVDKIPDLIKNELRFNLDIVKALQDKRITFGDFVSHLLAISSVEHINSHLDTLLGRKLREALANVKKFRERPNSAWFDVNDENGISNEFDQLEVEDPPCNLISDVDALMADLNRLFKFRHITAHEADFQSISLVDELRAFFLASELFIEALGEYVEQTLNPNAPRSGFGMSMDARIEAENVYKSMERTYQQLLKTLSENSAVLFEYLPDDERVQVIEKLNTSQNAFLKYLEEETSFQFTLFRPGTGNALRFHDAHVYMSICKPREERLKNLLNEIKEIIELLP
jgi:hypothetical protein